MKRFNHLFRRVLPGLFGAGIFWSCGNDFPENLSFYVPAHFPAPVFPVTNNDQVFHLGRSLFYDPILSSDSSISCGSCHAQAHGFADHNRRFSIGVDGQQGKRNAPALANLAWMPHFNWDGGVLHLEIFPVLPITEPVEMNNTVAAVIQRLQQHPEYPLRFQEAFGEGGVTEMRFFKALAAFMAGLISDQSRFDDFLRTGKGFNQSELRGYQLFQTHCSNCHEGALTSNFGFARNFVPDPGQDPGRMKVTGNPADSMHFRIPSLRNVELSYPYMHHGYFQTLEQVLDHYASPEGMGLPLSEPDKKDIISFLLTLTDEHFISNPKFSEP